MVGDQRAGGGGLEVPDTVHGVLTARIDRLAEIPKRLVQTAAVLGREFPLRLLQAMEPDLGPHQLGHHLAELSRLEFLYERAEGGEPVYVFNHALTQDVARATLVTARRQELHRRAADALQQLYPERVRELAPLLAHHYQEAEAWREVARHAAVAAELARRAYANQEALTRFDQALAASERAGSRTRERLALREARAELHALLGGLRASQGRSGSGVVACRSRAGRARTRPRARRARRAVGRAPRLRARARPDPRVRRRARRRRRSPRARRGEGSAGRHAAERRPREGVPPRARIGAPALRGAGRRTRSGAHPRRARDERGAGRRHRARDGAGDGSGAAAGGAG